MVENEFVHIRQTCRLCHSDQIVCSVPLAQVPIVSPNVGQEENTDGKRITSIVAPLDNYLCKACGLNQLVHVVDPSLIYRDYLYRTSVSLGLPEHFRNLADSVMRRLELQKGNLVYEFGSNDGTLLNYFKQAGFQVQGIDPAVKIAEEATQRGVPTRADFFGQKLAQELASTSGQADAIIANNAMANIDDLGDIFRGVKTLLGENGAFVFETQYALDVFEKTLIDVIYHEHISLFSVQPVVKACSQYGLEVFYAERIPTKGGSIRFWLQHKNGPKPIDEALDKLIKQEQEAGLYDLEYHQAFAKSVANISSEIHKHIKDVKAKGGRVGAYGTSVGCAALIHQFKLEDQIDFLFDDTPFKNSLEGPNYELPVFGKEGVYDKKPDIIIILAWRYADAILAKHEKYLENGGRFLIPLPKVSIRQLETVD